MPAQAFCAHPPRWQLDSLLAPFVYTGSASVLIGRLKFDQQRWLGQVLGQLLRPMLTSGNYDMCVPVPLHRHRLAQRGFNQALEIAQGIVPALPGLTLHRVLRRVRDTPPQTKLGAAARRRNLIDCFAVTAAIKDRRILLVDDVVTTGSTLNCIAELLRNHGARHIAGVAFARAVGPHTVNV